MILQVARLVRMQLYRITLSHLYRKLLVTHFHSTVSVLRPAARTSLWLNKQKKRRRRIATEYLAHVHNRRVWQGDRSRRAAASTDAFFLAACQTTVCLPARPLLHCCCAYLARRKEKGGGGNWPELVTKSESLQISWENVAAVLSSRFSRAPRCNLAATAIGGDWRQMLLCVY